MKIKFRCKPNKHQREFYNDVMSRLLHLSTGFGGGKTYILVFKLLQLSYLNRPYRGGLVVPDFSEFKKDMLPEMEEILEKLKIEYRYHQTEHWFRFPWSKGKVYVVSAEKKIRGPNWAFAVINELTLIPLIRYKEVIGRVRLKKAKHPQIASVGTPEGYASDYHEYLIENPPKSLNLIYGSTDDNLDNLHPDFLKLLEDTYDTKMLEAFRKGLWVNMNGSQFYYSYTPGKCWDNSLDKEAGDQYHISMDFNVDPFCATVWLYDGYSIYGVDQVELKGGEGYSTQNMCDRLKKEGYTPYNSIIYPDPAGRARSTKGKPDVTILENNGFVCRVRKKAPDFRQRQLNTNNLLEKGRVKFNPLKCKGIKKDFEAVEQDIVTQEKKKENMRLTHFSDGFDYMCDILFPMSGNIKNDTYYETKIR